MLSRLSKTIFLDFVPQPKESGKTVVAKSCNKSKGGYDKYSDEEFEPKVISKRIIYESEDSDPDYVVSKKGVSLNKVPKKRGRPRKQHVNSESEMSDNFIDTPKKRGRPKGIDTNKKLKMDENFYFNKQLLEMIDNIKRIQNEIESINIESEKLKNKGNNEEIRKIIIDVKHDIDNMKSALEIKQNSINQLINENKELDELEKTLKSETAIKNQLISDISEKNELISDLEIELSEKKELDNELNCKIVLENISIEIDQLETSLSIKKDLIFEMTMAIKSLEKRINSTRHCLEKREKLSRELESKNIEIERLEYRISEKERNVQNKVNRLNEINSEVNVIERNQELDSLKSKLAFLTKKEEEVTDELLRKISLAAFQKRDLLAKLDQQKYLLEIRTKELEELRFEPECREIISEIEETETQIRDRVLRMSNYLSNNEMSSIKEIYEKNVRKVPKDMIVSFVDKNKENFLVENLFCIYPDIFETPTILQYDSDFILYKEYSCLGSVHEIYKDLFSISVACEKLSTKVHDYYWRYKIYNYKQIYTIREYSFRQGQYYINEYGTILDKLNGNYVKPSKNNLNIYIVSLTTATGQKITLQLDDIIWSAFMTQIPTTKYAHFSHKPNTKNRLENLELLNHVKTIIKTNNNT